MRTAIPLGDEDVIILKKEMVGKPEGFFVLVLCSEDAVHWAEYRDLPVDGDGVAIAPHLLDEFKEAMRERGLVFS